jgi:hypothetical protein
MAETAAPKIEFPKEYRLGESNKITKKINRLSKKGLEKISEFIGTSPVEAMFYLYLLKKYKSPCFLIEATGGDFWEILGINLKIREFYSVEESEFINEYLERLAVKLVKCIKNDVNIIIIPLGLTLYYPDGTDDGHANVLIYRKKFNHIEHFEPHGKIGSFDNEKLNSSIDLFLKLFVEYVNIELFKNKTPEQIEYLKPIELIEANQVCPYINGFQADEEQSSIIKNLELESGGYCVAWSMFFTELCLKNPEMTSSQIITSVYYTALVKAIPADYFRHIIRGYATFINEKISSYFSFLLDKKIYMADITKMSPIEQTKLRDKLKIIISIEMELTFNPNALDDKIKLLRDKIDYKQYLNAREMFKISNEIITLEQYRNHINDFNSPMDTPSSFIPINTKKPRTRKIKEIKRKEVICPPGKVLNPKTNRCNNVKSKPEKTIRQILRENKEALDQELRSITKECPPGKVLNPVTGRCIKAKIAKPIKQLINENKEILESKQPIMKVCPPGKVLNLVTGRCIKSKSNKISIKKKMKKLKTAKKTKICPPGKMLNAKTKRCINVKPVKSEPKIKSQSNKLKAKICPPGKEINTKTGRCIKSKSNKISIKKKITS